MDMNQTQAEKQKIPEGKSVKTKEQKSFDKILHKLLVVGLVISVVLILVGLSISVITHQEPPAKILPLGVVFSSL
ncbi:MAG: hypothetical protein AB2L21_05375 [Anaerolineaceae bacterium]|jgi:magnesium-transporting ATPase (P-type)